MIVETNPLTLPLSSIESTMLVMMLETNSLCLFEHTMVCLCNVNLVLNFPLQFEHENFLSSHNFEWFLTSLISTNLAQALHFTSFSLFKITKSTSLAASFLCFFMHFFLEDTFHNENICREMCGNKLTLDYWLLAPYSRNINEMGSQLIDHSGHKNKTASEN